MQDMEYIAALKKKHRIRMASGGLEEEPQFVVLPESGEVMVIPDDEALKRQVHKDLCCEFLK